MKVSLNAVKKFSEVDISVDKLVTKIGAQLGAVETVEHTGAKYDGVIVARVVSCDKHPNADKLSVCWIDDGGVVNGVERKDGLVQVVCGAPNVRKGLSVAWLPPKSTVPSTYDKDPFVLGARELRGVVSNGMLASPSELAISDNHDGILEIAEEVRPGTPFKTLYDLDDVIIEIENKMFTHRPDCFGVLGVARELAGIHGVKFTSPDWYLSLPEFTKASELPLAIQNEVTELVPRFMAVAMNNVKVQPSPVWMQALLTRVGIKPISNVVDITNYLSYVTAQPLHAYDYDKVKERSNGDAKLFVRKPKKGETLTLLNGKTITPRDEAIMIATDKELVGVGGVMGGTTTEVDDSTKNIIIEVANFDMYSIRRTSMAHGLFTDAVTRFNKGQSPLQNDRVLAKAMEMMTDLAGAKQASAVIDNAGKLPKPNVVQVSAEFVNSRLGLKLTNKDIAQLLKNVEMNAEDLVGKVRVEAPFWRTDIEIEEDVVEEVGRLLGFDKLPLSLPKRTVTPTPVDKQLSLKRQIRSKLASLGANEVLTYSFVHGKLLEKAGQDPDLAFKLTNALSPDLQYYRLSLTPNLLNHVHQNIKAGYDRFALFEIGKVHSKTEIAEDGVPKEFGRVAFVVADKNSKQAAFYQARDYVSIFRKPGFKLVPFDIKHAKGHKLMLQMLAPYEPSRSVMMLNESADNLVMGVVGEFTAAASKAFKLPAYCAGFELFLSAATTAGINYAPLSRYPSISQDICLEVSAGLSFGELAGDFNDQLHQNMPEDQVAKFEPIDIYTSDDLKGKKRVTFRVTLTSYERTLTEQVLTTKLDELTTNLAKTHNAVRI